MGPNAMIFVFWTLSFQLAFHSSFTFITVGFPGGSDGKASACNEGLIPGSGRNPLEKEMVTHSSTLAWRIPCTEEPGRVQSRVAESDMTEWLCFSFPFIKKFFSSSSLFAIRVMLSAYLRLLIFLPAILIIACASSSLAFHMMYSAYRLNNQGDNI